jgi:hypothetical protein
MDNFFVYLNSIITAVNASNVLKLILNPRTFLKKNKYRQRFFIFEKHYCIFFLLETKEIGFKS